MISKTLQVFQTAPNPVETPHPSKHALVRGMVLLILAAEISETTEHNESTID